MRVLLLCSSLSLTLFIFASCFLLNQLLAIVCNRSAIEVRRYGRPTGPPKTPKMQLFTAVFGRGKTLLTDSD